MYVKFDAKVVADVDWSEFEQIINDCRSLLTQKSFRSLSWIRRQVNLAAHYLHRVARLHASLTI